MNTLKMNFKRFRGDDEGSSTAWSLFWLVIFLLLGGLVIDVANAYRYKSALRATADASALSAIISYTEEVKFNEVFTPDSPPLSDSERGQMGGSMLGDINMDPTANIDTVVRMSSVEMGYWNGSSFIPESAFTGIEFVNAARATALRTEDNSNALDLLLADKFAQLGAWDVGASAVAMTYVPFDCAEKEGIMAGGFLNFASNNVFIGDVCLHGEEGVDFNTNGIFDDNNDGDYPTVSYGVGGALCKGNCMNTEPYDNVIPYQSEEYPLTLEMIEGEQSYMPSVPTIYASYLAVVTNPNLYTAANDGNNRYIPNALVTNPNRDPETEAAVLVTPPEVGSVELADINTALAAVVPGGGGGGGGGGQGAGASLPQAIVENGVLRYKVSSAVFKSLANRTVDMSDPVQAATVQPFLAGSIIDIDGGNGSSCTSNAGKITLSGNTKLNGVVVNTSCIFEFNGANEFNGSMLLTSANPATAAVSGSSGAVVGNGTCEDDTLGSLIVSRGDVLFAEGFVANATRVVTRSDIHFAANSDAMQNGGTVIAEGDAFFAAGAKWSGCAEGLGEDEVEIDHYYRLVL